MELKEAGFLFIGFCSYFEDKGILNRSELAKYLLGSLEDERNGLSEKEKERLTIMINVLLPLRIVK